MNLAKNRTRWYAIRQDLNKFDVKWYNKYERVNVACSDGVLLNVVWFVLFQFCVQPNLSYGKCQNYFYVNGECRSTNKKKWGTILDMKIR